MVFQRRIQPEVMVFQRREVMVFQRAKVLSAVEKCGWANG